MSIVTTEHTLLTYGASAGQPCNQGSGDPRFFGCDTWTIIPLPSLSPAPPPSVYMCVYVSTPLSCFLQVHLSSHNILLGPCSDAESLPRPPLEQQTCSSVAQQRDWDPLGPTVPDMTIKTSVSKNCLFSRLAELGCSSGSRHPRSWPSQAGHRPETRKMLGLVVWLFLFCFLPSTIPSMCFLPFRSLYYFRLWYFPTPGSCP